MGLLTQNDAKIIQQYFKEMAALLGIRVNYRYPVDEKVTVHSEIQCSFSDIVPIDIVFQQNPSIKTLKNIGWVSETADDKPYIAMFPIDTVGLQTKAQIEIPPVGQAIPSRWFEVTSIQTLLEYPDCYITTVVPVFDSKQPRVDHEQTNYNYVDHPRANQPDEDDPTNLHPQRNFSFLKNADDILRR